MPQILAPYSPYDGLGGLVKALSIAAGLNIDLDNTNADRNQTARAQGPSIPQTQPLVDPTCPRHPACSREAGHSGRCRLKSAIQTKEILPDANGHRQCPYEKDCVNEAGHRGRCKIRPKPAATTQTPAQPSPTTTATRQDEEEEEKNEDTDEDSEITMDKCQRNVDCVKEPGHVGRCSSGKKKKPPPPPKQLTKLAGAARPVPPPLPKRKAAITLDEYPTSESDDDEEEEEEEEKEEEDSDDEDYEEEEVKKANSGKASKDQIAKDVEEIQIPKWPARKRPRGRLSGVHSDRKEAPKPPQQRKSLGSGSGVSRRGGSRGGRGGGAAGGRGGRPSSAAPAVPAAAAAPIPAINLNEALLARAGATPPAAPTGVSLVQQCRALEAALEMCGVTAYDRLSYSMKFAALPTEVREAQWDALQRHIDGGNVEAVVAAVREQARGGGARY